MDCAAHSGPRPRRPSAACARQEGAEPTRRPNQEEETRRIANRGRCTDMGKKKSPPPVARARGQQEHESAHNHITNAATTPDRPPTDYLNAPAVPNTDAALAFLI